MIRNWKHICAGVLLGAATLGAQAKADPEKVIRVVFEAADDGLDAVRANNSLYSSWVAAGIFETALTYDYLARPAKLVPGVLESMPDVTDDGKTYTFKFKKGIYFTPDPAFKGVKRELVAADLAYSLKRILDPKNRSFQAASWEGKIVGMDALMEQAKKSGKFDYDAAIAGIEFPDKYTMRLRLTRQDQNLGYLLAHPTAGIVAREVIEAYPDTTGTHPVGTGPYILKNYIARSKIVLEANPDYRGYVWDFKSTGDAWDDQLVREMKGKQMPQVGRVEVSIVEEDQSRWLAFSSGQVDFYQLDENATPRALDKDKLKPDLLAKNIKLYRFVSPDIVYSIFSMKDPIMGGYTPEKIALRKAIAMAYDIDEEIRQARFGQAIRAQGQVPPGVNGYDPHYRRSYGYEPAVANKLLDRFGYKKGADGFRTLPDGKPLVLTFNRSPRARDITIAEVWKRSMERIGIRVDFKTGSFADNLKAASRCEYQAWWLGNTASIPDGQDFMEQHFGPNMNQGNMTCYDSKVFNEAYEKARVLPDGPERQKYYEIMNRQLEADMPVLPIASRIRSWLIQPWVKGLKKHPVMHNDWMYLDVEKK